MFELFSNIYAMGMNLLGILAGLICYITKPRRQWVYVITFSLCTMLSNYYWGVYVMVMGDDPNTSSLLAYFGWNASFLVLALMHIIFRTEEEKKNFSPIALLPIPLNVIQFIVWLPYGGIFNSVWQGSLSTVVACFALNSVVLWLKKKEKTKPPYIAMASLFFITMEYVMWTSTCFDWPSEWLHPYNYACILDYLYYVMLPVAVMKTYGDTFKNDKTAEHEPFRRVLRPFYAAFITLCCVGGYLMALWMRNTLTEGIGEVGKKDPYSVIAAMLFVVSVVIVLFTLMVILVVGLEKRTREGRLFKEAKAAAEQANVAKSEFLANMSHEIRTPINAVLGMNEMILRESLEARDKLPEDRERVTEIFSDICNYSGNVDSAGKNLLSIINDILDFSKIESGKMEIVEGDYKLGSVLNDVTNMIEYKARSKGLKFDVEVDPDVPDGLHGDEVRVRQIMTNLLNNAVKYTHKGSVNLSVSRKLREGAGDEPEIDLVIAVKDTGIGIREEDIANLFGKFERVDLKQNSSVEGTGLGLAITRSLLEMMGGSVELKSVYGVGSLFTAVIPQRVVSDAPIGDFREKFENSIRSLKARKEKLHAPSAVILVVDDTAMNLMVVEHFLKDTGIKIDTAAGGDEAIARASEKKYDIIFMDQRMPGMDGVTAMHRIKEKEDGMNSSTAFICLTADAVSGARERYIAEGFEDYLTKPIDSNALEEMIMEYLPEEKLE